MILEALKELPKHKTAITTSSQTISFETMLCEVDRVADWLKRQDVSCLMLHSDNIPEWIYVDLACQQTDVVFVPVPSFFSAQQIESIRLRVKPDIILRQVVSDKDAILSPLDCYCFERFENNQPAHMPTKTSKITFTSGSTGIPKGVCLSIENQYKVARSLADKIAIDGPKHFCLLSFSTLLENIAGVYAPMLSGGSIHVLTDQQRGFNGAGLSDPQQLMAAISQSQPNTIILVPELLQLFLSFVSLGWQAPSSFEFIAVGGSKVAPALIANAHAAGLPVYQGYGLSECVSVVSLCGRKPGENKAAGQVLSHVQVSLEDNQVVVRGNCFLGYLDEPDSWYPIEVRTGDIATITEGVVDILGRSSNLIINSFGRNISPEWVESELLASNVFKQAVVVGDAKPFLGALLVPVDPAMDEADIKTHLAVVNEKLPEYARVKAFIKLTTALSIESGHLTSNGRPRRRHLNHDFMHAIGAMYERELY